MQEYKKGFIEFLVKNNALKFGEFTLKSGRISPYFINAGMFNDGAAITKLAKYYAEAIKDNFGDGFDVLYGPAYKGIPLCVATVIQLTMMSINKGYTFDRKEKKDYGDKGCMVGTPLNSDTQVIIIDDVITAGTAMREAVEKLKVNGNPKVAGIIISVNRKEKGQGEKSAIQEIEETLGVKVVSIIDFDDITEYCHNKEINGKIYLNDEMYDKMIEYKKQYGV